MSLESRRQSARYSSLQEFIGFSKKSDTAPSFTNLFSVHFSTPPMLRRGGGTVRSSQFEAESGDLALLLDYYAKNINLPSKQITTGQVTTVGSAFKYATGTAFSQISMTFTVSRSQETRNFFERWTSVMANDANQYTQFYNSFCAPRVNIYKWERGGGDAAVTDPRLMRAVFDAGQNALLAKKNKLTAVWTLENVFPYNIGSIQLNNGRANTMDLNVQFYYERYRFFPEEQIDDPGIGNVITIPPSGDDTTTTETSRNTTVRNPRALLDARQLLSGRNLPTNDIG